MPLSAGADSVVVFNEIMYHPLPQESAFEWVELHNQMAVDVDMSGWSLSGGVGFKFPEGTVISGDSYLVIAMAPEEMRAATGLTNIVGPFSGRLSNAGDTLELRNNNLRLLDEVSYGVEGGWPVGPDGSGVSLAKKDEDMASSPSRNWTVSALVGGTPGRRNFALEPFEVTHTNLFIPPPIALAFNEISCATNADFWIELINYGSTSLDLSGCVLARQGGATNREYAFPPQTLAPGALIQLSKTALGFGADPGERLFLFGPGRSRVLDAVIAKREPRGRCPDGSGQWWHPTTPTPGASNEFNFHQEIVINEIMYHPPGLSLAAAAGGTLDSPESWLELYNRSSNSVDLAGWQLAHDIDFLFPPDTIIPAGGYLVVAKDVSFMRSNYSGITVVGPFANSLRPRGSHLLLLDASGNPADEVRYFDREPWPAYADGGGSSLELRDPWADNATPEAWEASVESPRSRWSNFTYRAVASNVFGPTQWKEFILGLLDAGECLIDDLSVLENSSGTPFQMLQNGNFEAGLSSWRLLGNHNRSRVEADPDNPTNHVLHLIATGPTDHLHNHLETTLANGRSVVDGREYQISFRAQWLAGNHRLNTRLYFNRVAKTTALPLPLRHGTPGERNSTFATNIGPTFAFFRHNPVVPKPNEPVAVGADLSDPQGIGGVTLWWSVNGGKWNSVPMRPGSPLKDTAYTPFEALLPGQPAGALVQFFAQAADGRGATSFYPADGTNSRALFQVDAGKPLLSQLHRFRLLMTAGDATFLHAPTNVMSNERLGVTVVYDERQVFYNAGIHLQSSERGRNDSARVGFIVRLPADQLFRGVQNSIAIDRSGGYSGKGGKHDEILLWHAVNHAGGIPGFNHDLVQVFAPRTSEDGTGMLRLSAFDADYFAGQFRNGADGTLYTLEIIYYPTTTVTGGSQAPKLPQPDSVMNVEIQDRGDDQENYRWIFLKENHTDQDDYSPVIALNKAFSLTGSNLDTRTSRLMDVDEWLRTLAFKAFTGDGDTFTYGLNHNWKIYVRPEDGKALGLLWDMDYAFAQSVTYAFPGNGSPNTAKIIALPNNNRRFYNHLLDIMTTTVNSTYLSPWARHYARLVGQDWSGAMNYLQQRADYMRGKLPLTTPFAITNNGGKDFSTTSNRVVLAGTAPLSVKDIEINGIRYPLVWTSLTNWTVTLSLADHTNLVVAQGVDNYGHRLAKAFDTITITNTGVPALRSVVINEWMANNSEPGGFLDPVNNRYSDWLELYNPNTGPLDLAGHSLTDTLTQPDKWKIPTHTLIAAKGFLLVWADDQTNLNGSDPFGDLHANFRLGKSGEGIGLYQPDRTPLHTVVFGPQFQNISQGLFPDGNTNGLYYLTNWTPRAANQLGPPPSPQIATMAILLEGGVSLAIHTLPGRTYRVEYKDTLSNPAWTPLDTDHVAANPVLTVTDKSRRLSQRYYRVVLMP